MNKNVELDQEGDTCTIKTRNGLISVKIQEDGHTEIDVLPVNDRTDEVYASTFYRAHDGYRHGVEVVVRIKRK